MLILRNITGITWKGQSGEAKGYADFVAACAADGKGLPTFEELCRTGTGSTPVGGRRSEADMWSPIQAQSNGNKWVQIGKRDGGTCNPLSTFHGSSGSWMESSSGHSFKGVYGCTGTLKL